MLSQLFSAAIFIGVGLLFIDLVPIQENMMCETGSYQNVTECPDAVFSQSYFEARSRFVSAAQAAGAELQRHVIVEEDGLAYTTDVAVLHGSKKQQGGLLVHVSGTHGVEGYIGSAIQTDLLRKWNDTRKDGATVVFVHAVNPFGFAHSRRFNEHNVDLNRNCFFSETEWEVARSRDPNIVGYDDFRSLLFPGVVPTLFERYAMLFKAAYYVARHGFVTLKRTLVTGQYHFPEGPYFGGVSEEKSITTLKNVVSGFTGYAKVVVVDVHSGLGPEGVDTLMVSNQEELSRAQEVFDPAAFKLEAPDVSSGANAGYDLATGMVSYAPILGSHTIEVTEEFGTIPGIFVARAIIMENSAFQLARGSAIHKVTQDWLRDAFYPQKMSFKKSVLARGNKLFETAWTYLI